MVKIIRLEPSPVKIPDDIPAIPAILVGEILSQARPHDLVHGIPTKYTTSCPNCGYGITVDAIIVESGASTGCDNCKYGVPVELPPFEDPFLNPIQSGIIKLQNLESDIVETVGNDGKMSEQMMKLLEDSMTTETIEQAEIDEP